MTDMQLDHLSERGLDRRATMLQDLIGDMVRVHRRRRIRRKAIVAAVPALMLAAMTALWLGLWAVQPTGAPQPANSTITIALVHTDPTILDRWRVTAHSDAIIMHDDDLLEALAQLDRPTGLIRTGDHVWLTRPVCEDPGTIN